MKYHIVKREGGEPAEIISTHQDRDEALGIMEDYVRGVMGKKNGEDRVKLIDQKIKEKHYYQNKEYVSDISRAKNTHKFPLMDVARHYGPESYEWNSIPSDSYFCVRSREDLFRLSVYHKKLTRGIFRNGWTTVKLFDIEIVVDSNDHNDEIIRPWHEVYGVYYDGKDMDSVMSTLSSFERDSIINCLIESEEFVALQTPEHGFELDEELDEESVKELEKKLEEKLDEESAEEKLEEEPIAEAGKSRYYKEDS